MGIYADTNYEVREGGEVLVRTVHTPGHDRIDTFRRETSEDVWTSCFCCSCRESPDGYYAHQDPFCRNHGFAGTRICLVHRIDGNAYEPNEAMDAPDETRPLLSVQGEIASWEDPEPRIGYEATDTELKVYDAVMRR